MDDKDVTEDGGTLDLVHPLYLDVPMMISFLAALEGGGVAFEGEEMSRAATGAERTKEAGGRIGLPAIGALFGIDLTGRLSSAGSEEESRETKVLRRHTEASLFNLLRYRLLSEERVQQVSNLSDKKIGPGDLIEFEGEYIGNALQDIVDMFFKLLPYTDIEEQANKQKKNQKKSGNPAVRATAEQRQETDEDPSAVLRMFRIVHDDLDNSPVEDVVLQGTAAQAVLTLSQDFLSAETQQQMVSARLRVIGKVSRVLQGSETVNLMRRSALGLTGPEVAEELVESATKLGSVSIGHPIVKAPAVQIQPLAVFL
ncbi:MAG: hypothetical protein QM729_13030 [Solirubrobacterales bacterium]